MHLKVSSAKWRPFCPGGDELNSSYIKAYCLSSWLVYLLLVVWCYCDELLKIALLWAVRKLWQNGFQHLPGHINYSDIFRYNVWSKSILASVVLRRRYEFKSKESKKYPRNKSLTYVNSFIILTNDKYSHTFRLEKIKQSGPYPSNTFSYQCLFFSWRYSIAIWLNHGNTLDRWWWSPFKILGKDLDNIVTF